MPDRVSSLRGGRHGGRLSFAAGLCRWYSGDRRWVPAPCKLTGQPVTPPSQPGHLPRRPATKRGLKGRSRGGQGDGKRLV